MKRQKLQIRIKPKKERKVWQINPQTRVHDNDSYDRAMNKEEFRRLIQEEKEED